MSGRMDIHWQGTDITIERRSKGRGILTEFSAYETASGLPVTQLTAANCGQMLLGMERSVFVRSGFLRLTDLPVTQDEALRRRLNALVTTGDESGAADNFEQKLKELKNRCKFNRTGNTEAGTVYENINSAFFFYYCFDGGFNLFFVGNICRNMIYTVS